MPRTARAVVGVLSAVALGSVAVTAMQEPAPRSIPGVTAPDQFPRGCVDCHVNRTDIGMDVRLSTLMKQWQVQVPPELLARASAFSPAGVVLKGIHPEIDGEIARIEIPTSCLECHERSSSKTPRFAQLLHGLHLTGEENHFLSLFQGECTHCHKLDLATGSWSMGSGTEQD